MFLGNRRNLESRRLLPNSAFLNVQSRKKHSNSSPLFASRFCPEFPAHENAVFDLAWLPSNPKRFITVSADRSAVLWDAESATALSTFRGHQGSVKCVSPCFDDPNLFTTAGRDGHVMVWDARNRVKSENGVAPVNIIRNAHFFSTSLKSNSKSRSSRSRSLETPNAVSAVLFHDQRTVVSGSCKESLVRCWDLRKSYTFLTNDPIPTRKFVCDDGLKDRTTTRRAGFTFFATDTYRSSLFSPCTDNIIYEWSLIGSSDKPVARYRGATIRSFYVQCALSSSLPYLLCGSSDSRAYVWNLNKPESPLFYLDDHLEEVTSVAMNDHLEFATCSDDFSWRFWRYDPSSSSNDDVAAAQTVAFCKLDERYLQMKERDISIVEKRLQNIRVTPIKLESKSALSPLKENFNFTFDSGSKKRSLFISPGKENACKAAKFGSPLKTSGSKHVSVFSYPTPTYNLPNSVKDGKISSSPQQKLVTPVNKSTKKCSFYDGESPLHDRKMKTPSTSSTPSITRTVKSAKKLNDVENLEKKSKTLLDYFAKI